MPTYGYRCDECGATIEVRTTRYERLAPTHCERPMEPTIAPAALLFKGTGWGGKP